MLRTHRRVALITVSSLFVAAAMILVLLSPLGIYELVAVHHTNWERLSYVGQTYGVVSALLDAAALVGVVVSLLLQVRETALSRVQAGRSRHFELIQMAMQDPLHRRRQQEFVRIIDEVSRTPGRAVGAA